MKPPFLIALFAGILLVPCLVQSDDGEGDAPPPEEECIGLDECGPCQDEEECEGAPEECIEGNPEVPCEYYMANNFSSVTWTGANPVVVQSPINTSACGNYGDLGQCLIEAGCESSVEYSDISCLECMIMAQSIEDMRTQPFPSRPRPNSQLWTPTCIHGGGEADVKIRVRDTTQ